MRCAYNIALRPYSKGKSITDLSQKLSSIGDSYILGEKSLPHLTLYRLDLEKEQVGEVWKVVCEAVKQKHLWLEFDLENPSLLTFDNDIFWASLLPHNPRVLMDLHAVVAQALKLPINVNFDPHLTLINTKKRDYGDLVVAEVRLCESIGDTFVLSIGESDDIGQFTRALYTYRQETTFE